MKQKPQHKLMILAVLMIRGSSRCSFMGPQGPFTFSCSPILQESIMTANLLFHNPDVDNTKKSKYWSFLAIYANRGPLESPWRDSKRPPSFSSQFFIFHYSISIKRDQSQVFLTLRSNVVKKIGCTIKNFDLSNGNFLICILRSKRDNLDHWIPAQNDFFHEPMTIRRQNLLCMNWFNGFFSLHYTLLCTLTDSLLRAPLLVFHEAKSEKQPFSSTPKTNCLPEVVKGKWLLPN